MDVILDIHEKARFQAWETLKREHIDNLPYDMLSKLDKG